MDEVHFFPALEKIIQISGSFGRFVRSFLGEWKSDFFSPNETETHKTVADQTMFERSSKCILTPVVFTNRGRSEDEEDQRVPGVE
jgi:hypothetical protein